MKPLIRTSLATLLLTLGLAQLSAAQSKPEDPTAPRRLDIGINAGKFIDSDGYGRMDYGPQVTINFTRRHALQIAANGNVDSGDGYWDVNGYYTLQYRYTFVEHRAVRGFALIGGAGAVGVSHHDARTFNYPAVSYTFNGVTTGVPEQTYDRPRATNWDATAPLVGVLGVGADTRIAPRLILQGVAQLGISPWGLAFRVGANVTVPLGRVTR